MKRQLLRGLLRVSGLTDTRWRCLRPDLYCFNYHRIGDKSKTTFDRGVFSCPQDLFKKHVELLTKRFDVITVSQLIEMQSSRLRPRRPQALITFDDGYADNYTCAFPILREYGATATFFIPTSFIEGTSVPWWDEIAWSVRHASTESLRLRGSDVPLPITVDVLDVFIIKILRFVKERRIPIDEQVQEIREQCMIPESVKMPVEALFMTWAQISEMCNAGMGIGSHTHTHPILSTLKIADQRSELSISKGILEKRLGSTVATIAYPVGSASAYTSETCALAREVGYKLGFSFRPHRNSLPVTRPFEIGRFAIGGEMSESRLKSLVAFPWA